MQIFMFCIRPTKADPIIYNTFSRSNNCIGNTVMRKKKLHNTEYTYLKLGDICNTNLAIVENCEWLLLVFLAVMVIERTDLRSVLNPFIRKRKKLNTKMKEKRRRE